MAKKIFYFSLSLFILALILLGAYNFAFKNNKNNPIADPTKKTLEKEAGNALVAEETDITNPINESIVGASVSEDGFLYYYSSDDQAIKKATLEGRDKTVLLSNLPGVVTRALWSAKHDKVLLLIDQTGGGLLWYFSDLRTKSLTPLKGEMSRLAWDNLGENIFYQYTDPGTGKRSLNIANADGSNWKKVADLGTEDSFLASTAQSSLISFWNRPSAKKKSIFETVSTVGEGRRVVFSELFGGDYSWSPNGETLLVSGSKDADGSDFSLYTVSGTGGAAKNLSLPTLISKTAWSKDNRTLYYALPGALPENTLLPDDYFGKPLYTKDTFWRADLTTGKKTRLIDLKESTRAFDSSDLFLSPNEDALYFTDRANKRLYRIEL